MLRQDIYSYIEADKDLLNYLRLNPIWYRKLMRQPQLISDFQTESKFFFRKSIPDRVNQFSNGVQAASMMLSMFRGSA